MLAWMMGFNQPPERVFLVHGEPEAAEAMKGHIEKQFGYDTTVAVEDDHVLLDF
jgi:metallo-beta-lactamase family protein